ncbi:MAG: apiosidase-like domain-containing protein, partial [Planctomycetota bacterium]
TPAGTNSNPSSLRNFGHTDKAKWLTFHQIGNRRTHNYYQLLTEIFNTSPPVPGINGEPYYAGMHDAPGGSANSALYCRSGMYGSVLSGGLGGHIYGAGGWDAYLGRNEMALRGSDASHGGVRSFRGAQVPAASSEQATSEAE